MKLINDDITKQTAGLIIHGVNASGAMASGVALSIKTKWPVIYKQFKNNGTGEELLGELDIIRIDAGLYIGNGYTQLSYGKDGKRYAAPWAVDTVIQKAFAWVHFMNNTINALVDDGDLFVLKSPKIASMLGGLDWDTEVAPIFTKYEQSYGIEAEIYYI